MVVLLLGVSAAAASPRPLIRVGGPSAPGESKVAIVVGPASLAHQRFSVRGRNGNVALRGRLRRAPGDSAPWAHAYSANLSRVRAPGSYRVRVDRLRSRPWVVTPAGSLTALQSILGYFRANRDGSEPSPIHGPSHLNDALIAPGSPLDAGAHLELSGGWMDAGDMIHFTQTTAFATAMLEASARLEPAAASALSAEAEVGLRWLLAAHPGPGLFIAQVCDERDHEAGFRDPAADDASAEPGIGTRLAYPEIGGDLGGKAAAALGLGYLRTGDPAMLAAAREWYAAGARRRQAGAAVAARRLPALRGELLRRLELEGLDGVGGGRALPGELRGGRL